MNADATQRHAPDAGPESPRATALRAVFEVVLLWAAVSAGLLLAYEVVDRLVLRGLPGESRELARVLRYLAISLTASVVTGLFVLFRHVPSLRVTLGARRSDNTRHDASPEVAGDLAVWLLWLRWVAIVVLAGVVVATTTGHPYVAPSAIAPLWGGLLALFAFNLALHALGAQRLAAPSMLAAQIAADAAVLAFMIHHAGGLANPFSGFFVFDGVIAAIVLPPRRARLAIALLTALVCLLGALEGFGVFPPGCTVDSTGVCVVPDRLHLAATSVGVATLVYGCPAFVLALTGSLRREREMLRSIIECMADVVIFADTRGQVLLNNRAALALWPHGAPGAGALRVCHTQEAWDALLRKIRSPRAEELHPVLSVGDRSFEATYAPVRDPDGGLAGVVMLARDISERLQNARGQLRQERLAVVGQMSASLAHELNNPLSAISLFTQHALKHVDPGSALGAHLGTIRRNADLCTKVLRDLLGYARHHAPERREIDLPALVQDAARTLEYQAKRARVELEVRTGAAGRLRLHADRDQLLQVLVNLGLNAIEATDPDGLVTLQAEAGADGAVRIEVADTGRGMTPQQQDQAFDAFYTTKAEGTGLGLPVARSLVEAHGGRIRVESVPGVGTRFTVTLPRQAAT